MHPIEPLQPPADFVPRASSLGIEFEPGDIDKLSRYLALLLEANTQFNLTAITDPQQAWTRHILDSLTLVPFLISAEAKRIIDIGSGGGLPGIPLAIVMPEAQVTLVESTGKKATFLQKTAESLDLHNVIVLNERAETLGRDHQQYREQYDAVIARAVGRMPVLLELTVPLAKIGGHVFAMKGEKAAEEIADAKPALHLLHAQVVDSHQTPTGTIVVVEKQRKTPRVYPRLPGEPKRSPLH
jgi:16S rRNA (guanine527-N7)-methyltransferase